MDCNKIVKNYYNLCTPPYSKTYNSQESDTTIVLQCIGLIKSYSNTCINNNIDEDND